MNMMIEHWMKMMDQNSKKRKVDFFNIIILFFFFLEKYQEMKIEFLKIQMQNGNMIFISEMNKYQNLDIQYQDKIMVLLS
jgi:hypothetical protein